MMFDLMAMRPAEQYKLIAGTIIPRPIALVGTREADGTYNAAPYSFFNAMGEDPPVIVLGLQEKADRRLKDTAVNIRDRRDFVVHLVDEALGAAMAVCAIDFPTGESETEAAGLTLVAGTRIATPHIAEAPVSFECELVTLLQISPGRLIAVGRALAMHARDGIIDPATLRVSETAYQPVGRIFGTQYITCHDRFTLPVPPYAEWQENVRKAAGGG